MSMTIYDTRPDTRSNPLVGILTLGLGVGLLVWYVRGIGDAVAADIRYFPASFQSLPVLTIAFAILKVIAYVSFPILFVLMVYAPVRNLWLKRVVTGKLQSMSPRVARKGKALLSIELDQLYVVLPDPGGLETAIRQGANMEDELRFTIGAFSHVLRVEKLS